MAKVPTMKRRPRIDELTLDEIFELEAKHSPLIGNRTNVFLEPQERAGFRALRARLRKRAAAPEAFTLHEEKGTWPAESSLKKKPIVGKKQATG
jgi:hypothetical protein